MPGITLQQAEAQLQAYIDAEIKVLAGQSYELAGRMLKRADLKEIRAGITSWDRRVKELSARASGRGRSRTISPNW